MGSEAWLDKDTAVEVLGDVIAADFGWQRDGTSGALSPVQILASEVDRLRLDTGFVIASDVVSRTRTKRSPTSSRTVSLPSTLRTMARSAMVGGSTATPPSS
jgi:hypothetical protein